MDFTALFEDLRANRTEDAEAMSAYMRNQFVFLGLKSVARRNVTKPYFKEAKQEARQLYKENPDAAIIDWEFVKQCWEQDEREFQYVASDYLNEFERYLKKEDIEYFEELLTTKSWWDSVDALVKRVGYMGKVYPELKQTVRDWSVSDNIWLKRTSIINQLNMKEETDLELLSEAIVNNLDSDEFFINKGIGWALRDYARTDEEWVKEFIEKHKAGLAPLSIREATKHIGGA